jgi:hypothetical protein
MSTPKSDFSFENVSEEADRSADVANQQASGDLEFGAEEIFPGFGDQRFTVKKENESQAEVAKVPKKRTVAKVTGKNVNDMLWKIRREHLTFEVNGKKFKGFIRKKDFWDLSRDVYDYLKDHEQESLVDTSNEVAKMILNKTQTTQWRTVNNEDGTSQRVKFFDPVSLHVGSFRPYYVSKIANEISALRGKYESQKETNAQIREANERTEQAIKEGKKQSRDAVREAERRVREQEARKRQYNTSVEDIAKDLEKFANVKRGHRNELLQMLSGLYSEMESGRIEQMELNEQVREIADFMVENQEDKRLDESHAQEILDTMRNYRVSLTDAQKEKVIKEYGNLANWMERIEGSVKYDSRGAALSEVWGELGSLFPNVFTKVDDADMPLEIVRVYEAAIMSGSEAMSDEMEAMVELAFYEDLCAKIADSFWKIDKKITPEYRATLKAIAEKNAVQEFWKKKYSDTVSRNKALYSMAAEVQRIVNMKKGKYVNAANVKNDAFKTAIDELAKMNWRGGVIKPEKVRQHFSELAAWYTPKNALYGVDGKPNEKYKPEIATALAELGRSSKEGLTVDEIRSAIEVIKYFAREIETYGTIFKNGKREDAQPYVENYVAKIELSNQIVSRSSNIIKILRSNFARQFADPAMLMRLADSYVEGGFFTEQFEQLRQGTISASVLERELLAGFENFWSGAPGKAYSKRYNDTEIELQGRKMPIAEAISLYMTLKRDHTLAGAAYAGFEIEGKEQVINVSDGFAEIVEACRADILSKLSTEEQLTLDKDDHAVIEQQALREAADRVMKELDASFTEKDRELISIIEKIMEKCRDYKVAVDEILQGESNVTGGYYYPVKRTGLAENVDTMSMFEGDRVSNLSINKETVKNAHKLLIEPAHVVLMRHVKAISLYHGLGVFTDNFNRLYNLNISENANNPTTIRTSLGRASRFAKEMVSYFKEMKQDVEGISKTRTAEKWYNDSVLAIRSAYATYQLGFNLKTGFTQLSSVAASTSMLDPDALAKGIAVKNKGDVDEYCRLAWLRNNDGAAILAQTVTTGMNAVQKQGRGALQKVRDASMWHIGKMDRVVIKTLWGASQVQIEKDGGAKVGTEANKKAAGKLLERVILETQQNSLATERSAAMRSSDQILKALTMFRSDAMKLGARWLDAVGKWYSVNAQIRIAKDRLDGGDAKAGADIKRLQSEKKTAAKACARVTGAVMSTALFSAALSILWKWLMDRDDEENGWTFLFDVLGNLIGGVPVFSDIYSFFVDGFEVENFIFDTVNNVLGAIRGTAAMTVDAINGKEVSKQDVLTNLKKLAFALGQSSGISTRNIYNFITGIISRVSPEAGIWIEMQFSSRSVAGDLKKAMEDGDDQMVDTIVGIMLDQDGGEMNEGTRRATAKLIKSGYEGILPRSIPETLTNAQDVEIELTKKQRQQFEKVYSAAYRAADDLVRMGYFKAASKDEQAYALKFIWSTYYALAKDTVLGEDSTKKNVLFAEAIPVERLALIVAQASAIKADVDKNGKAINGSRMHKIEALIESLHLSAAQKYMMMGYLGYTNKKGRELVERYIRTLGLSQAEQAELLEMSGYREK